MNWIVMPCWGRPEMLTIALEALEECRGIERYSVLFAVDGKSSPLVRELVEKAKLRKDIVYRPTRMGPDLNEPEAMKMASERSDDFFIIVEDDMRVSKDFLEFMEASYKLVNSPSLFSISALGKDCKDVSLLWSLSHYYGVGVLIKKEAFTKYLEPHLNEEYYASIARGIYTPTYMRKHFPEFDDSILSWDGLTDRIVKRNGLQTYLADVPRCQEIGFYGFHKPVSLPGYDIKSTEEKVSYLRKAIAEKRLNSLFVMYSTLEMEEDHRWTELKTLPLP